MAIQSIKKLEDYSPSPAGANSQIQYNNNGVLGASSNMTFDGNALSVGGNTIPTGVMVIARISAELTDVTGDGTVLNPFPFDLEDVDLGGDFVSNVFTAPSSGYYYINAQVQFSDTTSNHNNAQWSVITSNEFGSNIFEPWETKQNPGLSQTAAIARVFYMDAADTAQLYFAIATTDKTININTGSTFLTINKVII